MILLDPADTVAVAATALPAGSVVSVSAGEEVRLLTDVPFGHKVSRVEFAPGEPVVKYGEVIGIATERIPIGAHVHVHNLVSARLP